MLASTDYARRTLTRRGTETVVTLTGPGKPLMRQRFVLSGSGSVVARVELVGKALSSNWMAPIVADSAGCVDLGRRGDVRALRVPFDNDHWARYNAGSINGSGMSYEVAAFYDNRSRNGLIAGSVTHDTWKTGIGFGGRNQKLDSLTVYGGASGDATHDVMSHGWVSGNRIVSPAIWVGFFPDWRHGMESFADANAARTPALKWAGGVPFGWNSWGKIQQRISYDKAVAVSDFVARDLQPRGFSNRGTVYINLDSFWDNLSADELRRFVAHVHANGQKAGIYWAPFVYWGTSLSQVVDGSRYTYGDIVLRNASGERISLDTGLALDPTHPGTRQRIDHFIDLFRADGFDYLKLDFLTHGALEGGARNGRHYDPSVQTGIQAYNTGMRYLVKRIAGRMFISASIAPIFPYQYAHARRVSCDSFGAINETEYVMNSAGYGWWLSGRLYAFNDPDHIVLEGHSANENASRVTSGAVCGTVFLSGDDLSQPAGGRLAAMYLTNHSINAVARLGRPFRPVEGNTGSGAPDLFTVRDGANVYLAAFNFNANSAVTKHVDLSRSGLDRAGRYVAVNLWTGESWPLNGTADITLGPAQSTIIAFRRG
jgi:hypothetical protein